MDKIRCSVAMPFFIEGHWIQISASVGVAVYPDHAADEQALMQCADQAMYQAKAQGGDQHTLHGEMAPQGPADLGAADQLSGAWSRREEGQ